MLKNLSVNSSRNYLVNKKEVHKIVLLLRNELDFTLESILINFISAEEIIPINKKYLNHNYSTDIITFNYSGENYTLDGEIFISLDDAYKNSRKFRVPLDKEIVRLVIHGFLHLIGFDDKNDKERKIMKKEENKLVNKLFNKMNKIVVKYDS